MHPNFVQCHPSGSNVVVRTFAQFHGFQQCPKLDTLISFLKDELFYLNGKHFLFRQKVVSSKLGSSQIHEKLVRVEFQSIIIMRVA